MPIDLQALKQVPQVAAASRIKYIRNLDDEQLVKFYQELLLVTVEAKDEGNWDRVSKFLEEWEDKLVNVILLGRDSYESGPFTPLTKPLDQCKVAFVTTAGLYLDGQQPFNTKTDHTFRILPKDVPLDKFRVAHDRYDTSGILEDIDTVFPINILKEMAAEGIVGSVADMHYGFMGFIPMPGSLVAETAPEVARRLKEDGVDAVIIPTTWPVCIRSGGLIARAIEELGIATVVFSMHPYIPEWIKMPRALVMRFPFGRPLGVPGDKEQHRVLLEDALQLLITAREQNTIVRLPYRWKRTDFAAILAERSSRVTSDSR